MQIAIITIITISVTSVVAIGSGCICSKMITQPLAALTQYARGINSNATRKQLTKDISIDLNKLSARDSIGELINAFKLLVHGLSDTKKNSLKIESILGTE